MFESSMANFSLTGLPRVFLEPRVPGFVSNKGTVCLPLTLDGEITDTGIPSKDTKSLEGFLRERSHFFASSRPEPVLYPSEDIFKAVVQPFWLTDLSHRIDKTLRDYDDFLGSSTVLDKDVRRLFLSRWSQIQSLISASLYTGLYLPNVFMLFSQDLSLYAVGLRPEEVTADHLTQFLGSYWLVGSLIASRMTDQVCVLQKVGSHLVEKPLYDISSEQTNPRPLMPLRADANGHVDPTVVSATNIHPAYHTFQDKVARENMIFMGYFFFSLYRFEEELLRELMGRPRAEQKAIEMTLRAEIIRRSPPEGMKTSVLPGKDEAFLMTKALAAISRLIWA